MGGRSLRYTAEKIYKSGVQQQGNSLDHGQAEDEVLYQPKELQNQLGGAELWEGLVVDLQNSKRFQGHEEVNGRRSDQYSRSGYSGSTS
mmetsp:Transcript_6779/g.11059  ORF Transcript_6779/g.11059 Transcript_6779/m.11059 type:complete len:89 (+) Transcript_6779:510-776(+)